MTTFTDIRTARKLHAARTRSGGCDSCYGDIKPGEKYVRWSATPHDETWSSDHWAHGKAHHPYGSCSAGSGAVTT